MSIDIGIASLADLQPVTVDGTPRAPHQRVEQIVALAVRADQLGLDHFGLGEHHNVDFAVSSPAVVLAAIAARTAKLRLTSSVTTLSALDPVRVYQDFATVDVISGGRAELTVGRSAYPEPFALFGASLADYEQLFEEKLDLLLRLRESPRITWSGRFRSSLTDAAVVPRATQAPLPVWIGVGGTPSSAARAGRLGLPMILGYIGGTVAHLRRLADVYRDAGEQAGHAERLRLGVGMHYLATEDEHVAADAHRYYHDFLRPKAPGAAGFTISRQQFTEGRGRHGHLMVGTVDQVTEKLIDLVDALRPDRIQALLDWGGLPEPLVNESLTLLGTRIAPAVRKSTSDGQVATEVTRNGVAAIALAPVGAGRMTEIEREFEHD